MEVKDRRKGIKSPTGTKPNYRPWQISCIPIWLNGSELTVKFNFHYSWKIKLVSKKEKNTKPINSVKADGTDWVYILAAIGNNDISHIKTISQLP